MHASLRLCAALQLRHGALASAAQPAPPRALAWLPRGTLVAVGAAALLSSAAVVLVTLEQAADRRAVAALPLLEGNPVVFLDLADGEAPLGRVLVQLRADAAPRAAENFRLLCTHAHGFGYRRSAIFGIERGRRLLGGDFYGSGGGSFSTFGDLFDDEAGGLALRHLGPGTVAMRASRPHANGSQFYLTLRRLPELDGRAVVVGYAADAASIDVLERVGRTLAGDEGRVKEGHDLRVLHCGELDQAAVARLRADKISM